MRGCPAWFWILLVIAGVAVVPVVITDAFFLRLFTEALMWIGLAITWEFVQILWTGAGMSLLASPQFYVGLFNLPAGAGLVIGLAGLVLLPLPLVLIVLRPGWLLRKNFDRASLRLVDCAWLVACLALALITIGGDRALGL